jgi:hypothetical protein
MLRIVETQKEQTRITYLTDEGGPGVHSYYLPELLIEKNWK